MGKWQWGIGWKWVNGSGLFCEGWELQLHVSPAERKHFAALSDEQKFVYLMTHRMHSDLHKHRFFDFGHADADNFNRLSDEEKSFVSQFIFKNMRSVDFKYALFDLLVHEPNRFAAVDNFDRLSNEAKFEFLMKHPNLQKYYLPDLMGKDFLAAIHNFDGLSNEKKLEFLMKNSSLYKLVPKVVRVWDSFSKNCITYNDNNKLIGQDIAGHALVICSQNLEVYKGFLSFSDAILSGKESQSVILEICFFI